MKGHFASIKWIMFFLLLALACLVTDVSLDVLFVRGARFFDILAAMVPPNWQYASMLLSPLAATVQMSIVGTVTGAVLGLCCAWCANAYSNRILWLRAILKLFIHMIRTIPALILALFCTFVFGLGTFAGTVALALYTFAILARLGYEDMENADPLVARALEATGCGRMNAFSVTILRQVMPSYLNNCLYVLEANVRHAAILGYVGAGGIGFLLNERLSWREYGDVGMILTMLYVVVFVTEVMSERLRQLLTRDAEGFRFEKTTYIWALGLLFTSSLFFLQLPEAQTKGWHIARIMVNGLLQPDMLLWNSLAADGVPYLLLETLCIAFVGTVAGAAIAILLSFASSWRVTPWGLAVPVRAIVLLFRTIPVVIYGFLWIRVTGPGPFAGVLTLAVCSVGLLTKRFLNAIDAIDLKPYHAYRAMGISRMLALRHAVVPQLVPHYMTAIAYRFDINLRDTAVLGLVGAGGIGTPLILTIMHYEWQKAGAMLLGLFMLVTVVEVVSEVARKRV